LGKEKNLRDVKVVLREKERELAILKKQVEALKIAAALLEEEYRAEAAAKARVEAVGSRNNP
jgi:hypothetical protein